MFFIFAIMKTLQEVHMKLLIIQNLLNNILPKLPLLVDGKIAGTVTQGKI